MTKIRVIFIMLLLISCSNKIQSNDGVVEYLSTIGNVVNESELYKYYTKDTRIIADQIKQKYPNTDVFTGLDRIIFRGEAEFSVIEKKINGKNATVVIRIDHHDELNYIGMKFQLELKYENGKWLIDRSNELEKRL